MNEKRSLHVGLNYAGTNHALSGCVNDANDMADLAIARGYQATVLLENDATRERFFDVLKDLLERTDRGDDLLVTQSSHGTYVADRDGDEPDGRDEALVMWDFGIVTDDELFDIFAQRAGGSRVGMVLDTCHSGTANRFSGWMLSPTDDHPTLVRFLPPTKEFLPRNFVPAPALANVRKPFKTPVPLIGGCDEDKFSYDAWFQTTAGWRANGAFTRALIDAAGEAADWRGVHRATRTRLPTAEYPQEPQLQASSAQKKWKFL